MYHEYFGLTEPPFSIAPNPRYLYMSERHREALAHLVYGLNSDGAFILLTGDVGTGKTTVSRCLLEQIPENTRLALVLNPKVSASELLQTICDELHIQYSKDTTSIKDYVDLINRFLLGGHAQGKKTVVLIEEAQNLDLDVLEQLRLLTNLETNEHKLLQIILLGQPEFLDVLQRPELSQLAQRITARYHLKPLSFNETLAYISHRLAVAGCREVLFKKAVLKRLYKITQGIPRVINLLCDRALLGCYVQNKSHVELKTLEVAAREVLGDRAMKSVPQVNFFGWASFAVALVLALALVVHLYIYPAYNLGAKWASLASPPVAKAATINTAKTQGEASGKQYQPPVWPSSIERLRSNSLAFQSLFTHWKLNYDPQINGTPCFYAQSQGLSCLHGNGSIKEIRGLNRPAVLQLKDDRGYIYFATLAGLGRQLATIKLAGKQQTWSLAQLRQHWSGDFTLLWKQPPGYLDPIHPGYEGREVIWLSQKINQLDQSSPLPEASIYQAELIERIRQFQLSQGILADGVVNAETLIRINNVTGLDAPVLKNNG
jgi:general secretion pathway protein A